MPETLLPPCPTRSRPVPFAALALASAILGGAAACGKDAPAPAPAPAETAAPATEAPMPAPGGTETPEEARPRRGLDGSPGETAAAPALPTAGVFAAEVMAGLPSSTALAVTFELSALDGELAGPAVAILREVLDGGELHALVSPVAREAAGGAGAGVIAAGRLADGNASVLAIPLAAPDRLRAMLGDAGQLLGAFTATSDDDPALKGAYLGGTPGAARAVLFDGNTAFILTGGDDGAGLVRAFRDGPRLGAEASYRRAVASVPAGAIGVWVASEAPVIGGIAVTLDPTERGVAFTAGLAPSTDALARVLRPGGVLPAQALVGVDTTLAMGVRLQPSELLGFVGGLMGSDAEMVDELKLAAKELVGMDLEREVISLLTGDLGLALEGGLEPERGDESEAEAAIIASLRGIASIGVREPERVAALLAKSPSLEALRGTGLRAGEAGAIEAPIPGGTLLVTQRGAQVVATNSPSLAERVAAAPAAGAGLGEELGQRVGEGHAVAFLDIAGTLLAPALPGMVMLDEAPWPPPPVFDDAPEAQKKLEGPLNEAFEAAMAEWRTSNESAREAARALAVAAGRVRVLVESKAGGLTVHGRWMLGPDERLTAWFERAATSTTPRIGEARGKYEALRRAFVDAGDDGGAR
jgi:hypothetical protein